MKPITALLTLLLLSFTASTSDAKPAGKYAAINGLSMYYEVHGKAVAGTRPIVLVHGAFCTIDGCFGKLLPVLAEKRQVIALELQGHGHTADIDRPMTIDQLTADTAALMKTILGSRLFYSGHAFRKRIKSPVEYAVGAIRAIYRRYESGDVNHRPVPHQALVKWLGTMGQALFAPPNVKGWPGGRVWLNTSTVLERDNFASVLASGALWRTPGEVSGFEINNDVPPPKALDPRVDPTSFDNGEDHGNLDGVLAVRHPTTGDCQPTLRLVALYRGLQDRQLLAQAAACDAAKTEALAARMVPSALGDAEKKGDPSWPTDDSAWELARRELLQLASCAKP